MPLSFRHDDAGLFSMHIFTCLLSRIIISAYPYWADIQLRAFITQRRRRWSINYRPFHRLSWKFIYSILAQKYIAPALFTIEMGIYAWKIHAKWRLVRATSFTLHTCLRHHSVGKWWFRFYIEVIGYITQDDDYHSRYAIFRRNSDTSYCSIYYMMVRWLVFHWARIIDANARARSPLREVSHFHTMLLFHYTYIFQILGRRRLLVNFINSVTLIYNEQEEIYL